MPRGTKDSVGKLDQTITAKLAALDVEAIAKLAKESCQTPSRIIRHAIRAYLKENAV
jgi:predicted transcriptional regulator